MTEDDVIQFVGALPGVITVTAGADNGAPEVAWGDSFFFYDPDGSTAPGQRLPFATVVIQDYAGFDTASQLARPGVFRVNVAVGRRAYQRLFGHSPAAHAEHHDGYDYAVLDALVPHPVYAVQGWVSVLNPGPATTELTRGLLTEAHARAAARFRPTGTDRDGGS